MKIFNFKYYYLLLIFIICLIIYLNNYQFGSWLTGWDNLHPEFNFWLNLKRTFFAIWQEYRGLGLWDGMAHAANLTHTLIIWWMSLIIPQNLLRWVFTFSMHFLGGAGMYLLSEKLKASTFGSDCSTRLIQSCFASDPLADKQNSKLISFLTSLFYLLNIGTIQMFYTPLEVFTVHFAALPWLSLLLINFLQKGLKKDLFWFGLLSFLFTPQAFVPTLFLVYLLSVVVIGLLSGKFRRFLKVFGVIIIINAFWVLPYFSGLITNAKIITSSKINQMANENILLNNKQFGDFRSAALIRGFSLDYIDIQGNNNLAYLMKPWREHLDNPSIEIISWLFFGLAIWGGLSILINKQKSLYSFLILFSLCFLMLASDTPILNIPFNLATKDLPLFKEVFRFSFTKFTILYVFCYSILIGMGLGAFFNRLIRNKKIFYFLLLITFCFLLFFYSWPAFKGNFIYENLKVNIPQEYYQVMDFFRKQNNNSRLSILPQPDFWGWTYYNWGFRGSGFIWQGLPQASMDGAFMPWSNNNENYYWEISRAVYSSNLDLLEAVLEKYQLQWLVLDKNIRGPENYKTLYIDEIQKLAKNNYKIKKIKDFGNLEVYQVVLNTPVKDFVFLVNNLSDVGPKYNWNDEDIGFLENGHYITKAGEAIYYPLRSLFSGRKQEELEFGIKEGFNTITLSGKLPVNMADYQLITPEIENNEAVFWTQDLQELYQPPSILLDDKIKVTIFKQKGYFSYDSLDDTSLAKAEVVNCDPFSTGKPGRQKVGQLFRFTSENASSCLNIGLNQFIHKTGYVIKIESQNISGQALSFKVVNESSKKNIIETYLPKFKTLKPSYFIIPVMEEYGSGYTLSINNISIGREKTVNDLGRVEVYPIPYNFLKEIKLIPKNLLNQPAKSDIKISSSAFRVIHPNPSFYKVVINDTSSGVLSLVLSQSFHSGWIAWLDKPFFGKKLNHVLVNNWENGWDINIKNEIVNSKNELIIYVFFWPQILQYLGFGLLGITLIYGLMVITSGKKTSNHH